MFDHEISSKSPWQQTNTQRGYLWGWRGAYVSGYVRTHRKHIWGIAIFRDKVTTGIIITTQRPQYWKLLSKGRYRRPILLVNGERRRLFCIDRWYVQSVYYTWYLYVWICETALSQQYSYVSRVVILVIIVCITADNKLYCMTTEYKQKQYDNVQLRQTKTNSFVYCRCYRYRTWHSLNLVHDVDNIFVCTCDVMHIQFFRCG